MAVLERWLLLKELLQEFLQNWFVNLKIGRFERWPKMEVLLSSQNTVSKSLPINITVKKMKSVRVYR